MTHGRPAAGGDRWVDVDPERVEGWVGRFVQRHGATSTESVPGGVRLRAADGSVAELRVPFPPMAPVAGGAGVAAAVATVVAHAEQDRTVGVLLVRLGGHAAGVFHGLRLVASKVGVRHVQGRSAAGGWSQQRFARRREHQGKAARAAAAEAAVAVLLPASSTLDAVVLGGDRRSVDTVMGDARLGPLRGLVVEPHLDVADPRLAVLRSIPRRFRSVRVLVTDRPTCSAAEPSRRPGSQ